MSFVAVAVPVADADTALVVVGVADGVFFLVLHFLWTSVLLLLSLLLLQLLCIVSFFVDVCCCWCFFPFLVVSSCAWVFFHHLVFLLIGVSCSLLFVVLC